MNKASAQIGVGMITYLVWKTRPDFLTPLLRDSEGIARVPDIASRDGKVRRGERGGRGEGYRDLKRRLALPLVSWNPPWPRGQRLQRSRDMDRVRGAQRRDGPLCA
jgi:hypothetical protein